MPEGDGLGDSHFRRTVQPLARIAEAELTGGFDKLVSPVQVLGGKVSFLCHGCALRMWAPVKGKRAASRLAPAPCLFCGRRACCAWRVQAFRAEAVAGLVNDSEDIIWFGRSFHSRGAQIILRDLIATEPNERALFLVAAEKAGLSCQ